MFTNPIVIRVAAPHKQPPYSPVSARELTSFVIPQYMTLTDARYFVELEMSENFEL
jgi:hypothetical protein